MKNIKRIISLLLVFALVFSLAACKPAADKDTDSDNKTDVQKPSSESSKGTTYPLTIKDSFGNEVVLDAKPEKIASGAPSITEMIYAIGQEDLLVGVTENCNYPAKAAEKNKIGAYTQVVVEKIIDSGAQLYLSDYVDDDTKKTLNDAGIKVAIISSGNIEGIFNDIKLIGQMLDASEDAEKKVESLIRRKESVLTSIKGQESVRVFNEVWHDPLTTSGPGSFMDEMITLLGGENISHDAESAYPAYSIEKLIEKNPQVYLTADDGFKTVEDIKAREGYDKIDAIKNDRIYFLDADVISRPGPRIIDALYIIAQAMYPKAFEVK